MDHASYLLVLGERRAIAWVLGEQRMAFPRTPRPEVARLAAFPKPHAWSAYLRRPLVPLTPADARLLDTELAAVAGPCPDHLPGYLVRAHPPREPHAGRVGAGTT